MEKRILKEFATLPSELKVDFIRLMAQISFGSNGASLGFWEKIADIVASKSLPLNSHNAVYVFYALASVGKLRKDVQAILEPHLKQYLEGSKLNYRSLKYIIQGVLFADIKDEQLLIRIFRGFSRMNYYAPAKYYSTFKQFRLHLSNLFPEWNYSFYDNRLYHATAEFNPYRSMNQTKEKYGPVTQATDGDLLADRSRESNRHEDHVRVGKPLSGRYLHVPSPGRSADRVSWKRKLLRPAEHPTRPQAPNT